MPDIHVSMLALHVPNLLPKSDPVDRLCPPQGPLHQLTIPRGCATPAA